jgi:aryl-alcohol dehydrogenase-like predicted oxidoreductase
MHRDEAFAIDAAAHRSVGILVKKALGSGHLDELWQKTPAQFRITASAELEVASTPAKAVGGSTKLTAPHPAIEAAIRFALARTGVSSVVVGTTTPAHLATNVAAALHATRHA